MSKSLVRRHTVAWRDAHFVSDETNREDTVKKHKPAIYWSVGVLVQSDETGVTLAMDFGLPVAEGDDPTYRSKTFIPRELIIEEFDDGPLQRRRRKTPPPPSEPLPFTE